MTSCHIATSHGARSTSVGSTGHAVIDGGGPLSRLTAGKCEDGTYSHAKQHRGACSGHGGVAEWYK